jgi:hypothetical protein
MAKVDVNTVDVHSGYHFFSQSRFLADKQSTIFFAKGDLQIGRIKRVKQK